MLTLAVLLLGLLAALPSAAHEIRPVIVRAELGEAGAVTLEIGLNLEAVVAGGGAAHHAGAGTEDLTGYESLRATAPEALRAAFAEVEGAVLGGIALRFDDGPPAALTLRGVEIPPVGDTALPRFSTVTLAAEVPAGAQTMTWAAGPWLGDSVIRVTAAGEAAPFFSALVPAGEASAPIAVARLTPATGWQSFLGYIVIGFEHIVPLGLDHILFVVGLFLLSARLKPLLWQVTGFTLAHTITLALGIYGVVRLPPSVVEPLIAASIVFIAVENLFTDRLQRWRPGVVFGFGLLHGLGFAGVLAEVGLPREQFAAALVGFNIGVELGQLAVLAACFLAVGFWFRDRAWYRRVITIPASGAIAAIGAFWFLERIA